MEKREFSMKELYDVKLKTTYPMEIKGKRFETGETIASFDKVMLANFQEIVSRVSADGGYLNRTRVLWEETKGIAVDFSQGIFSKTQYSILNNAKIFDLEDSSVVISQLEQLETDENGIIELKEIPIRVYFRNIETAEKITDFEKIGEKSYRFNEPYKMISCDYEYEYINTSSIMTIGQRYIKAPLYFEGRTTFVDDETGVKHTGIIKFPRLRLMSDLTLSLGKNAIPVVGRFSALAEPTGARGKEKTMEIVFLNNNIDSDIQ